MTSKKTFSFGDFELSSAKRLLLKRGEIVSLNSKTFDLLLALVENHGQILSKDELLDKVWEGQFVEENNLSVQISALRKIFGENKNEHRYIATIPGKGYKFVAEISIPANDNSRELVVWEQSLPVSTRVKSETPLIGRMREMAEIKDLLRQEKVSLLTLTGTGGSGKTSLARAVADELNPDFADGVFFVELAAATEPEVVISAVAQTLNLTEVSDKLPFETVKEFLQTRKVLLVLDNFEQVLSAAPLVEELLTETTSLKIMATSRTALHIDSERDYLVLPLDLPPPNLNFSIEQLIEFPAIALFCQTAQTAKPNFVLSSENISAVAEICRRLDGLPLAIELAAARVKLLAPQAILERLENSLKLLTGGSEICPPRQRTMRGTIQWSYDLLKENEKFLFRNLAVFAGGFTVEAAESVVNCQLSIDENNQLTTDNEQLTTDVLNLLESLIDNNLLVLIELSSGDVRLRMLEVVREFAFEILQETGELDDLQKNHAEFFLSLVEKAEPLLHGEDGNEWLEKLETEYDNLRSALSWSLKNEGQMAARIAAALRFFWLNRSYLSEGLSWSKAALQATENSISQARSDLLLSNGVFLRTQGNLEAARKFYEKSLEESRQLNDLLQIIKANHGLAAITVLQKDFDLAQQLIEEALALSRQLKDEMQTAYSLASLGDLEMSRENLSAARPLLEECLTLSKKLVHKRLLTVTYFNLGTLDYFENSFETANFNFTESLQIAEKMGNMTMISCAIEGFAALAVKNGKPEKSAKLAGAAESLRESIGYYIEPAEEIFRNKYLAETRTALSEKQFTELYAQGQNLNLDEATALIFQKQSAIQDDFADDDFAEIIIEHHKFERITIDEKIEPEKASTLPSSVRQTSYHRFFLPLLTALTLAVIGLGYWIWAKN